MMIASSPLQVMCYFLTISFYINLKTLHFLMCIQVTKMVRQITN